MTKVDYLDSVMQICCPCVPIKRSEERRVIRPRSFSQRWQKPLQTVQGTPEEKDQKGCQEKMSCKALLTGRRGPGKPTDTHALEHAHILQLLCSGSCSGVAALFARLTRPFPVMTWGTLFLSMSTVLTFWIPPCVPLGQGTVTAPTLTSI